MEPVIQIRNLSKQYRLGESAQVYGNFREALASYGRKLISRPRLPKESSQQPNAFWALKDISFDVHKGETVAILGSNGAGKSTLLKVLSRITDPTEGYAKIRGQMASLLEVGTGFHPELTGRENIYLNGAILGMSKNEIRSKFDEIASFAGIGGFLDTPVKRYSSGMYVRLAFSIAAHLDPEVLIVDEVLAVGDVAFQKKCLGKMAEACARAKTVLFVSHNLAAVESLCTRAIVLQQGRIAFAGETRAAIEYYLHHLVDEGSYCNDSVVDLFSASGRTAKYKPQLKKLELLDGEGQLLRGSGLPVGSPLKVAIHFDLETCSTSFDVSVSFDTLSGQRVCVAHTAYEPTRIYEERFGPQVFVCDIPTVPLIPGEYKLTIALHMGSQDVDVVNDATRLTILKADFYGTGIIPEQGTFLLENRWTLEQVTTEVNV